MRPSYRTGLALILYAARILRAVGDTWQLMSNDWTISALNVPSAEVNPTLAEVNSVLFANRSYHHYSDHLLGPISFAEIPLSKALCPANMFGHVRSSLIIWERGGYTEPYRTMLPLLNESNPFDYAEAAATCGGNQRCIEAKQMRYDQRFLCLNSLMKQKHDANYSAHVRSLAHPGTVILSMLEVILFIAIPVINFQIGASTRVHLITFGVGAVLFALKALAANHFSLSESVNHLLFDLFVSVLH
jgi:hypothetical protein